MKGLKVECYAGYRADQRPVRIVLRDRILEVVDVRDQWYGPSARYFRVLASDGNLYVIRHDEESDGWDLTAFRQN
jgi:hypothetical protein